MNLSLPVFLDIAIGLTLIYLLLSLLASEIEELFAWIFRSRAYQLKKSIQILLGGTGRIKTNCIEWLLQQIKKLIQNDSNSPKNLEPNGTGYSQQNNDPDIQANALVNDLYKNSLIASLDQPSFPRLKRNNYGPSYIDPETFATALIETIQTKSKTLDFQTGIPDDIESVILNVAEFPSNLKHYLTELALRAKAKVGANKTDPKYQFQQEVQAWFERSQKRTSGAYKRIAKVRLFLIGLFAAFLANADTFHIVNSLYNQPKVRQAVTQVAVRAADSCKDPTPTTSSNTTSTCEQTINTALALDELPMGWKNPPQLSGWSIGGWIVSAVAVAMGATFWFDLLKNLVNVRNAGPKPVSPDKKQDTPK